MPSKPVELPRRSALLGFGAASLARPAGVVTPPTGLRDIAAASGIQFGSASAVSIGNAPEEYAAVLALNCGVFAPTTRWTRTLSQTEAIAPVPDDPNIRFALQHGMKLSGGRLLWEGSLPAEFLSSPPGSIAQAMAAAHSDQTVQRYAGRAFSWNVVTDILDTEAGDAEGLRLSPLRRMLGPDFIKAAFQTARAADPAALLACNEGELEMDTPRHAARRAALLRLLDRLQRQHTPIDAVGLQTHIRLDGTRFDPALYRRFLRDIAARGLRILITEMDVCDVDVSGGVEWRDDIVATTYRDVLSVALAEPAFAALVTSGLSDRYSWLATNTNPNYARADGLPVRPLPLNDQFQAKPAFKAIAAALQARV